MGVGGNVAPNGGATGETVRDKESEVINLVDDDGESRDSTNHFSLFDYARLFFLLRDNERARKAWLDSRNRRTAGQMDASLSPDAFWKTIVELLFND